MAESFNSLLAAPVLRTFVHYLISFCSRPETACDVIFDKFVRLTVPSECVKFRDPRSNRSGEIRPNAVRCGIFSHFANFDKCRPEVAGDVTSSVALDCVGMNVCAKFGDSRLNGGRIIRLFGQPDPFHAFL